MAIVKTDWETDEIFFGRRKWKVLPDGTVVGLEQDDRWFDELKRIFDLTIEEDDEVEEAQTETEPVQEEVAD